MTTSVSICNMALARAGVSQTISSLTETSTQARMCNQFYEPTRQSLLREFPWPFAERYFTLALIAEEPNSRWNYSYRFPSTALRINEVVVDGGERVPDPPVPFKIGSDSSGRVIYCDEAEAVVAANTDISDVNQFDPLFVDAFAWRMAWELSSPLSQNPSYVQTTQMGYERAIRKAMAAALNEERPDEFNPSLLRARE